MRGQKALALAGFGAVALAWVGAPAPAQAATPVPLADLPAFTTANTARSPKVVAVQPPVSTQPPIVVRPSIVVQPPAPTKAPVAVQPSAPAKTPASEQPAASVQPRITLSWAEPQIAALVSSGVMGSSVEQFRPNDALTRGELADALTALGHPGQVPTRPDRIVRLRDLDAQLVNALGLIPQSRAIRLAAAAAGLAPHAYVGTETVARILGLRTNHPQGQDELELAPGQPATRAEAAYSLEKLRTLQPWQLDNLRTVVSAFAFPVLTELQRSVVGEAVRFVGLPYVWAGTSEGSQFLFGKSLPGGFDCSGLVWRVYKLQAYDGAATLAAVIKGRTTFEMSGEVKRSARIPFDRLEPGDVLFFGDKGPQSSPLQVGHAGIYVGSGWMVHSSGNGVTLQPLQGWYLDRFAWARRPLSEAGLEA